MSSKQGCDAANDISDNDDHSDANDKLYVDCIDCTISIDTTATSVDNTTTVDTIPTVGNAYETVKVNDPIKVITVRGTAFEATAADGGSATITEHSS